MTTLAEKVHSKWDRPLGRDEDEEEDFEEIRTRRNFELRQDAVNPNSVIDSITVDDDQIAFFNTQRDRSTIGKLPSVPVFMEMLPSLDSSEEKDDEVEMRRVQKPKAPIAPSFPFSAAKLEEEEAEPPKSDISRPATETTTLRRRHTTSPTIPKKMEEDAVAVVEKAAVLGSSSSSSCTSSGWTWSEITLLVLGCVLALLVIIFGIVAVTRTCKKKKQKKMRPSSPARQFSDNSYLRDELELELRTAGTFGRMGGGAK